MPLVRVVTPTFNRAGDVIEAVRTAQAQTFSDLEIIVVDDGSSDDTVAVLTAYARTDARIRVIAAPHGGAAAARNVAIAAPGPHTYVAFLDSDDRWEPRHLEQSVALLERVPELSLVSGAFATQDLTGTWTPEEFAQRAAKIRRLPTLAAREVTPKAYVLAPGKTFRAFLRSEIFPYTSTVVVRAAAAGPAPWFDLTLVVMEDSDFYLRLGANGKAWGFLDDLQCVVRFLGDNLTRSRDLGSPATLAKQRAVLEFCRRRLAVCADAADRAHVSREAAGQAYLVGQCCDVQGDRAGARRAYAEALRMRAGVAAARGYAGTWLPQRTRSFVRSVLRHS